MADSEGSTVGSDPDGGWFVGRQTVPEAARYVPDPESILDGVVWVMRRSGSDSMRIELDGSGRITGCNDRGCGLLEYESGEHVVGVSFVEQVVSELWSWSAFDDAGWCKGEHSGGCIADQVCGG
jgi:PAS domain-containing protein